MTKRKRTLREFSADVLQGGLVVASVSGPNKNDVMRDIVHYAMLYLQDGPVVIRENGYRAGKKEGKAEAMKACGWGAKP